MSDLHCPATLVLAGHAETGEDGALTDAGRAAAVALARSLAGRRVAAVQCSDLPAAVRTAELAGAELGVAVTTSPALGTSGPTGAQLVEALDTIADEHRGETVLVVGGTDLAAVALRQALGGDQSPGGAPVELDRDADGWVLRGGG